MNKKYVFWPFISSDSYDGEGGKHGVRYTLHEFARPNKSISYIRYGSKKHLGRLANCNDPNKSLYITGHGGAGLPFICTHPLGNGEKLSAMVIVDRLIEYGLRKSSRCKIKIFTCESGAADVLPCFADIFWYVMQEKGYTNNPVFGYKYKVGANDGDNTTIFWGEDPEHGKGVWRHASRVRNVMPQGVSFP